MAADALRLEIASPAIRAAFLIEMTEAAVAVGDMAVAVTSYQEAREVVEHVDASRLQQLVESKLKFDKYDVVEQLARLEGKLHSRTERITGECPPRCVAIRSARASRHPRHVRGHQGRSRRASCVRDVTSSFGNER